MWKITDEQISLKHAWILTLLKIPSNVSLKNNQEVFFKLEHV